METWSEFQNSVSILSCMTLGPLRNKTLMTNEDIYLGSSQVVRLVISLSNLTAYYMYGRR